MKAAWQRILFILGFVLVLRDWMAAGASFREAWALTVTGTPALSGGADWEFATGNAQTVKRWRARIWEELPKLIYWNKFMSTDENSVIVVFEDLEKQAGDTIHYTMTRKLQGSGVIGDADLEQQEEVPQSFMDSIVINQKRNAVRLKGRMSERRTAWNQRKSAKNSLTTWMAETIDADIFAAIDLSPSTSIYGGSASSIATIAVGDYLTTALITKAKTKAKKAVPKIWPVKVGNKEYYIGIISPDQEHDLKVNDATWAQAQREAQQRGDDNPIFEGSVGVWDGVIIHVHENIATATNFGAGTNLPGAYAMFVGRQAGGFCWGESPRWVEKEFDFGNKVGFAIGAIYGVKKSVFNAVDYSMFSIRTYRTNV